MNNDHDTDLFIFQTRAEEVLGAQFLERLRFALSEGLLSEALRKLQIPHTQIEHGHVSMLLLGPNQDDLTKLPQWHQQARQKAHLADVSGILSLTSLAPKHVVKDDSAFHASEGTPCAVA